MRLWLVGLIGSVLALAGTGCSTGPRPVKVQGTVHLDGKPLAAALVTFVPQDRETGRPAIGRTDENGEFELTTFSTDDGALPGTYKVTVAAMEEHEDVTGGKSPMEMNDKEKMAVFMKLSPKGVADQKKIKPRSLIPTIYSNVAKTPLQEVVPPTRKIELNLKMTAR